MNCIKSLVFVVLGCVFLSACSTTPLAGNEENGRTLIAKRFLRNVGAGQLAMSSFRKTIEKEAVDNPGIAELSNKVFADVNEEAFITLASDVYSRNLSSDDLEELANFSESPTIKRFFAVIFDRIATEQPVDRSVFKQFNSDEILEVMKFSVSGSFTRMSAALPKINKELSMASASYGQELFRNYMKTH